MAGDPDTPSQSQQPYRKPTQDQIHYSKEDFLRYAIELQCLNPVAGTRKSPLPPLEELAEGTIALIEAGLRLGTKPRRELEKTLKEAGTQRVWYPEKHFCEQDLSLNTHLGAGGAMSTGRV